MEVSPSHHPAGPTVASNTARTVGRSGNSQKNVEVFEGQSWELLGALDSSGKLEADGVTDAQLHEVDMSKGSNESDNKQIKRKIAPSMTSNSIGNSVNGISEHIAGVVDIVSGSIEISSAEAESSSQGVTALAEVDGAQGPAKCIDKGFEKEIADDTNSSNVVGNSMSEICEAQDAQSVSGSTNGSAIEAKFSTGGGSDLPKWGVARFPAEQVEGELRNETTSDINSSNRKYCGNKISGAHAPEVDGVSRSGPASRQEVNSPGSSSSIQVIQDDSSGGEASSEGDTTAFWKPKTLVKVPSTFLHVLGETFTSMASLTGLIVVFAGLVAVAIFSYLYLTCPVAKVGGEPQDIHPVCEPMGVCMSLKLQYSPTQAGLLER